MPCDHPDLCLLATIFCSHGHLLLCVQVIHGLPTPEINLYCTYQICSWCSSCFLNCDTLLLLSSLLRTQWFTASTIISICIPVHCYPENQNYTCVVKGTCSPVQPVIEMKQFSDSESHREETDVRQNLDSIQDQFTLSSTLMLRQAFFLVGKILVTTFPSAQSLSIPHQLQTKIIPRSFSSKNEQALPSYCSRKSPSRHG